MIFPLPRFDQNFHQISQFIALSFAQIGLLALGK
jgi:hypothetical protein